MVVVPGGWEVGENPTPKAREFYSPMARSLTSAGLSNIESGSPQATNNNFVGWKL